MKVFCHASNTTSFCYLKKHHNQFREKYVHMSKLDLSMRHRPIYSYKTPGLRAFWFLLAPSHVWRLEFDSPRTGYFFNMFLSLGLRSLRTLFLTFVAGLQHTMVLCYIAPIPFRTTSMIFRPVALPLEILISRFVSALTSDLLQISRERFFCDEPSVSWHPPRNFAFITLVSGYFGIDFLDTCSITRPSSTSFTVCAMCASADCWMSFTKPITSLRNKQSNIDHR